MTLSTRIEEIIELDRLNMATYFIAANAVFDASIRRAGLAREIAGGAKILEVRRDGRLAAYLEYVSPLTGDFHVHSLQIHPCYKGTAVLRPLLAQAVQCMRSWPDVTLRTRVHMSNALSIRMHSKLGFSQTGSSEGRLLFEVPSSTLRASLLVYLPRSFDAAV